MIKETREQKAQRILSQDGIRVVNARLGEYLVRDIEGSGDWHDVNALTHTCDCYDAREHECKHQLSVAKYRELHPLAPLPQVKVTMTLDQFIQWAVS